MRIWIVPRYPLIGRPSPSSRATSTSKGIPRVTSLGTKIRKPGLGVAVRVAVCVAVTRVVGVDVAVGEGSGLDVHVGDAVKVDEGRGVIVHVAEGVGVAVAVKVGEGEGYACLMARGFPFLSTVVCVMADGSTALTAVTVRWVVACGSKSISRAK